ncbi:MAG TPA: hypothetical protein DCQ30_06120 [Acidimicrobiaceae bacterium]|nr:hypothetical protein [Acidimicrobiaceae bacterium]
MGTAAGGAGVKGAEPAGDVPEALGADEGESAERSRPAFYAARSGGWRDWWTLLHPPYTAWHLSYVVIGAALAPRPDAVRLVGTLLAFFLAVGVAAHALDELHGRPLRTSIPAPVLVAATVVSLAGAVALGGVGVARVGASIVPFIVLGPLLVVAYNAELLGGVVHTDVGFALSWGAFPVLTAYVAQAQAVSAAAVLAAVFAFALSLAQRALSTPARRLRRTVTSVHGTLVMADGTETGLDRHLLMAPLERALRTMSWAVVALAAGMAVARLG